MASASSECSKAGKTLPWVYKCEHNWWQPRQAVLLLFLHSDACIGAANSALLWSSWIAGASTQGAYGISGQAVQFYDWVQVNDQNLSVAARQATSTVTLLCSAQCDGQQDAAHVGKQTGLSMVCMCMKLAWHLDSRITLSGQLCLHLASAFAPYNSAFCIARSRIASLGNFKALDRRYFNANYALTHGQAHDFAQYVLSVTKWRLCWKHVAVGAEGLC